MDTSAQRLVRVTPSERQLAWQQLEFEAFLHYGVNAFTDREWGTGQEDPAIFHPTELDTDQWCRSMQAAGIRACIITAKHHDGFCLWDTAHTDHSVMHSPYGKDIVAQLADSCRRYGLKLGIYLSPWDRHDPRYGYGESYNDYFVAQLTELGTKYGDIYCFWFDGACGEGKNGKKQAYDFPRYYETIRRLQPNAVISVCGPDVRWCGNEGGHCRDSEWSVVSARMANVEKVHDASQKTDDAAFRARPISSQDQDLGSREALADEPELIWYPAEVNVSIRPGWFYHAAEDDRVRPLENLLSMYTKSVGGNGVFLLNLPPDTRGRIHENDARRLEELGAAIRAMTAIDASTGARYAADAQMAGHEADRVASPDGGCWKPEEGCESATLTVRLDGTKAIGCVVLQEDLTFSQRIEAFTVALRRNGADVATIEGTTVGYKRICPFAPTEADEVQVRIARSRVAPTLRFVGVYGAGA